MAGNAAQGDSQSRLNVLIEFLRNLKAITQPNQGMGRGELYQPVEGNPVIKVEGEHGKKPNYYALWRVRDNTSEPFGDKITLVDVAHLAGLAKPRVAGQPRENDPVFNQAYTASMKAIITTAGGTQQPVVTLQPSDLVNLPAQVKIEKFEGERTPSARPRVEFDRVAPPPAPVVVPAPAPTIPVTQSQPVQSLEQMGVLGKSGAAYDENHKAARKAIAVIAAGGVSAEDKEKIANSFEGAGLKPFAKVVRETQNGGFIAAADALHAEHRKLNRTQRDAERAERAVSPEDAAGRVRQRMKDPAVAAGARDRAEAALGAIIPGGMSPENIAAYQKLALMMQDPKLQEDVKNRLSPEDKAFFEKLPRDTQKSILENYVSPAMQQQQLQQAVLNDFKGGNDKAAREKLIAAAAQGAKTGIDAARPEPAPAASTPPRRYDSRPGDDPYAPCDRSKQTCPNIPKR